MPEPGAPGCSRDRGPPGRAASLRRQLLIWLLPVAGIALGVSAAADFLVARHASSLAHDQGLADAAVAYVERMQRAPEVIPRELPAAAQRMLLAGPSDRIFFRLQNADGSLVAGDSRLPLELPAGPTDAPAFFDHQDGPLGLRGVGVRFEAGGRPFQITIATTTGKRDRLMAEVVLGMALPEAIVLLATVMMLAFGIRRALASLAPLRREIARRSQSDLGPLDAAPVPEEIRPVVDEINHLLARLDRALRSQRNFVADAAHQLRTPVAGLLAQVEAVANAAAVRPVGPEDLTGIVATAGRLSRLVAQLLTLARTDPGSTAAKERLDLAEVAREAAEEWLPRAFAGNCDVQFDIVSTPIDGTRIALREMLANLLDNALRHGRPDGRVHVACRPADGEALVVVEDDGPGIPAGEREHAFERFRRLPGTRSEGSGLGLAIVRAVARQHGGRVLLGDSALGGLSVEVRLPAATA